MLMNDHIFKAYDIRGIVKCNNRDDGDLDEDTVKRIGYYLGEELKKQVSSGSSCQVCIAYDIRTHSPMVCQWLTSGFNANKVKVYHMGMSATPVSYFAGYIQEMDFACCVMITASHNPKAYNGFKITINNAPFFGEQLQMLKERIKASYDTSLSIPNNATHQSIDINSLYMDYMVEHFAHLKGMTLPILLDSGNGSVGFIIDEIFQRLSLHYTHLFKEPDGTFPNHHPDPSESQNLQAIHERMEDHDIAFAYDGDGDRLAVITKAHNIKGDILATIFAKQMDNPTVIAEVKSSTILYNEVAKIGKAIMCKTGHSHIKEKIKATNAKMAAEVSGHIFFNDRYFGYDDAIYATLRVLELIDQGINLDSEIAKLPQLYSTQELKTAVPELEKFAIMAQIDHYIHSHRHDLPPINNIITIDGLRIEFGKGWGLIRVSNTTPYLISRFEASNQEALSLYQQTLEGIIQHILSKTP